MRLSYFRCAAERAGGVAVGVAADPIRAAAGVALVETDVRFATNPASFFRRSQSTPASRTTPPAMASHAG